MPRARCNTEGLPASDFCRRRGHEVVIDQYAELTRLKASILMLIDSTLEEGNIYHYESALKSIRKLVR